VRRFAWLLALCASVLYLLASYAAIAYFLFWLAG
jgi:hypothetical protein